MKLFAAAAIVLLSLASSFSYTRRQTTTPVRQNQRDTMILPSEHNDSPFDFNHMAAGNDKSDELGVPVLPAARPVMPLHAYLCIAPSPGLFYPRAMPGRTRRRPKTLI